MKPQPKPRIFTREECEASLEQQKNALADSARALLAAAAALDPLDADTRDNAHRILTQAQAALAGYQRAGMEFRRLDQPAAKRLVAAL